MASDQFSDVSVKPSGEYRIRKVDSALSGHALRDPTEREDSGAPPGRRKVDREGVISLFVELAYGGGCVSAGAVGRRKVEANDGSGTRKDRSPHRNYSPAGRENGTAKQDE